MAIFQDFITTREAAEITGYHSDYIGALIRSGKVSGKRENRSWFVSKSDIQKYLMTKHYVPASAFIGLIKRVLFVIGVLIIIVSIGFGAVLVAGAISNDNKKFVDTEVKKSLTDMVEPKGTSIQIDQ